MKPKTDKPQDLSNLTESGKAVAEPKLRLRKSRLRDPDWAAGNAAKYFSYAEAWARINQATKQGYFLGAVTIQESIISDRLTSFLQKTCAITLSRQQARSLALLTERWAVEFELKLLNDHEQLLKSRALQSRLNDWRVKRNDVVHGLVKSSSGKYENHIDNFLEGAKESAAEGKAIAREVSGWVQVFKKRGQTF